MDREQFIIILCGICILLIMVVSLRGCIPCKREGFSPPRKKTKKILKNKKGESQPEPYGDEGQKLSPSVIFENQDKVNRLKSEMCDNREYVKLKEQVENLQKSVKKIKEANAKAANT